MEEENRDNSFELRVSEKERNYLTGKNRGTGVSKGKSLRNTVKNKPAGEQPPAEVIVLVRELRRVRYVFEEILKVAYKEWIQYLLATAERPDLEVKY